MRKVAYWFAFIGCILSAFALIPLIWTIPMVRRFKDSITDHESHVALGILSLFFLNFIAGILMLCSGHNK
ncbi:MAG: hypothetical protein LBH55_03355 [Mycoplasmataceae bacterium]|nr:hypothetical protein [Mycoplasmataceae bacterium]